MLFDIDEVRKLCTKARRDGETRVDLTSGLCDGDKTELIEDLVFEVGVESDMLADLRDIAYDAWVAKATEDQLLEQADEFIAKFGSHRNFVIDWIEENFRITSPVDRWYFRKFVEDCGFGFLLKPTG